MDFVSPLRWLLSAIFSGNRQRLASLHILADSLEGEGDDLVERQRIVVGPVGRTGRRFGQQDDGAGRPTAWPGGCCSHALGLAVGISGCFALFLAVPGLATLADRAGGVGLYCRALKRNRQLQLIA